MAVIVGRKYVRYNHKVYCQLSVKQVIKFLYLLHIISLVILVDLFDPTDIETYDKCVHNPMLVLFIQKSSPNLKIFSHELWYIM